jgi:hypothetical protein
MSKYHDELQRRLKSDATTQETAEWFMRRLDAEPQIQDADLTELERQFCKQIVKGYAKWKRDHKPKNPLTP